MHVKIVMCIDCTVWSSLSVYIRDETWSLFMPGSGWVMVHCVRPCAWLCFDHF